VVNWTDHLSRSRDNTSDVGQHGSKAGMRFRQWLGKLPSDGSLICEFASDNAPILPSTRCCGSASLHYQRVIRAV